MKLHTSIMVICLSLPSLLLGQLNGIGNDNSMQSTCLSHNSRIAIKQRINENRILLNLTTNSSFKTSIVNDLLFPLVQAESIPGYKNFYGVSNYLDHDNSNGLQDYNCLDKTYNGHKGSDFFTFPFEWYLYENDLVHVVSSFDGTIVLKQDGNNDTNCTPNGNWNAVYVQHSDGSTMWYGHLKTGSLTSKSIGETVERGEYLGVVASSGFSTGPHLHIEYYDMNDNLLDPFQGSCNSLNSESLWETQLSHSNPEINAVLTHSSQPNIECGPTNEVSAFSNEFYPNDNLYVGVYLTDYIAGSIAVTSIYRPDNSLYASFNSFNNQNSYNWFWNSREYMLLESDPVGTWTVECTLGNNIATHTFELIDEITNTIEFDKTNVIFHPNPTKRIIKITGNEAILIDCEYYLTDCYGRIVKKGLVQKNEVSIEDVSAGLYYMVLMNNGHQFPPQKIIKY